MFLRRSHALLNSTYYYYSIYAGPKKLGSYVLSTRVSDILLTLPSTYLFKLSVPRSELTVFLAKFEKFAWKNFLLPSYFTILRSKFYIQYVHLFQANE